MKNLTDKVVWITGASSGIGEALTYALAKENVRMVLSSRNEQVLQAVKAQIGLPDERVLILPLDLEHLPDAAEKAAQVVAHFGRIDILVNNGGISQRSLFNDTTPEVFRRIMEINFFGAVLLTRAVVPQMVAQKGGKIVTVSSVTGKFGTPWRSAYAASKHALHGFYDALQAELYDAQVSFLMVAPGYVKTRVSYNALLGDGTPNNALDVGQANGISAEACARQIVRAIKAGKHEIYPGQFKEVGAVYLKRFLPGVLRRMLRTVNVR